MCCLCASKFAPGGQFRLQLAFFFRTSRRGCVLSGLWLCPSRASSQCFSQAPGASRSQHCLSSFLLTKYGSRGCDAAGSTNTDDHRPNNTRSYFSAPEAVLNEVEQRFDCAQAQAQTHMYRSLVGGFHSYPEPYCSYHLLLSLSSS